MLDFQPNAVHAGIYAALARGYYADEGVDLEIREPSASTDAPKLLAAGRAEFAILDIHDFGIARERGLDIVGIGAIVAAAARGGDRRATATRCARPRDLEGNDGRGHRAALRRRGARLGPRRRRRRPGRGEPGDDRLRLGAALAAGQGRRGDRVLERGGRGAARLGVPTREFRVDEFGAPRYPELVLATTAETLASDPRAGRGDDPGDRPRLRDVVADPDGGLGELLAAVPELDPRRAAGPARGADAAGALGPGVGLDRAALERWARGTPSTDPRAAAASRRAFPPSTG